MGKHQSLNDQADQSLLAADHRLVGVFSGHQTGMPVKQSIVLLVLGLFRAASG